MSVRAGAGASAESSPQAKASTMIAVYARATGLTARLNSLLAWAGRPATPALAFVRLATLAAQSTTILYSDLPAKSSQFSLTRPTKLDDRQNHLRDVAEPSRLTVVCYRAIMTKRQHCRPCPTYDPHHLVTMEPIPWQLSCSSKKYPCSSQSTL